MLRRASRVRTWPIPPDAGLSRHSPDSIIVFRSRPLSPWPTPPASASWTAAPDACRPHALLEPPALMRGRPRFSSHEEGGRDCIKAGARPGRRWRSMTVQRIGDRFRCCGQSLILDDAADDCNRFGVRGASVLDTVLLDACLPCLSSSCSRSGRPGLDPASVDNTRRHRM